MIKDLKKLHVGSWLHDTEGIYEITAFSEKGNTFCTVKEVCFLEDDSDDYELGDELFLSREEVKHCELA